MFKKILVAEDIDAIKKGIAPVWDALGIVDVTYSAYCDDALLKAKRALYDKVPFELLLCDLSFIPDHRNVKLQSGEELIAAIKKEQPDLKIIVYSYIDHPQTIKPLWEGNDIDGYVWKDRKGSVQLVTCIQEVYKGQRYLSPKLSAVLRKSNMIVLGDYETRLLQYLENGLTQDEIQQRFETEGVLPSSKSSIEKRLKELKDEFNAKTPLHLVTILRNLRLL